MKKISIQISEVNLANPKDAIFKLDFTTTLENYKLKSATGQARKYSDFNSLSMEMASIHPSAIIPPLPSLPKSPSTFTTLSTQAIEYKTIEDLQTWIDSILNHPSLAFSPCLQSFLECNGTDFGSGGRNSSGGNGLSGLATGNSSKSSVSSFFKSVAKSVKTPKEVDNWFETKKVDVSALSTYTSNCLKSIEKVSKNRKALGSASTEFGYKISDMGETELNSSLCLGLRKFGSAFSKVGNLYTMQSEKDVLIMTEKLTLLSRYCDAADKAFGNRTNVLADYEDASKNSLKKKQAVEKLKTSSQTRVDKVESAMSELSEAQTIENETKGWLGTLSHEIKEKEWFHFTEACGVVVRDVSRSYARVQMELEGKILEEFKDIINDIHSISLSSSHYPDVTGGGTSNLANEKIAAEVL